MERQDLAQVDAIARWQGNRYLRTARADYLRSVTKDLWNRDTKQGARTSPLADLYHPPTVNPWPEVDEALDLCAALDALPPRQRYIIGQLLAGTPAREIAADLGVHESRVSQLRARAVRSLRQAIKLDQDQNDPRP